jgi:hypothetical protein
MMRALTIEVRRSYRVSLFSFAIAGLEPAGCDENDADL